MPVTQGTAAGRKHIVGWLLAFMAVSLALTFANYTGHSYFAVAIALCRLWRSSNPWAILYSCGADNMSVCLMDGLPAVRPGWSPSFRKTMRTMRRDAVPKLGSQG